MAGDGSLQEGREDGVFDLVSGNWSAIRLCRLYASVKWRRNVMHPFKLMLTLTSYLLIVDGICFICIIP